MGDFYETDFGFSRASKEVSMKIGTHNGVFQADDALAVAMLRMAFSLTHTIQVVRTRDPKVLETCDIVVDVGAVYDHDTRRYDHHQEGRAGMRPNGVLYSACGLIWRHYGAQICDGDTVLAERVDRDFVQGIDAIDNGQALFTGGTPVFEGARSHSLSGLISSLNPVWYRNPTSSDFDTAFEEAVVMALTFLRRQIDAAKGILLAKATVDAAIQAAAGGHVLELARFVPWQEYVVPGAPNALYVVFKDETGTWMVQCVPDVPGGFGKRKELPEAWAGKRGADLAAITGVPGAVFCHSGRFICGADSREGALRLAGLAVAGDAQDVEDRAWMERMERTARMSRRY